MTDGNQALGFERMETQMVREAVRVCADLYVEEIGRQAIQSYGADKGKQAQFIADAWAFPGTVNLFLLSSTDNLKALWKRLRDYPALFNTVCSTAVKLRGYYSAGDWNALIDNLGCGSRVLEKNQYSVMDEVAVQPFNNQPTGTQLLDANAWAVVPMLTSYLPLTSIPKTLQALSHAGTPTATTTSGNAT